MHAVETFKMPLRRVPDVGGSLSSRQGEGLVPAVETLKMSLGGGLI